LIGINAVLLNNSVIGKNCIIGANCLITQGKIIPNNSMVLGSPGKVVREVTPAEIEDLRSSAEHYVKNFKRFIKELKKQD
jgi:carbonic anhydrase/acetyltransferase-like protein (isoleucine patch superfamily)